MFRLIALASAAGVVSADYISMQTLPNPTTCEGNPLLVTVIPGCIPLNGMSQQYTCTSKTSAMLSSYLDSEDCSGTPTMSMNSTLNFGCMNGLSTTCETGDYDIGSAVATYTYDDDQCPSTKEPQMIQYFPCGTCIDFGATVYIKYDCNATAYTTNFHAAEDCSDDAYASSPLALNGCTSGTELVMNQVCTDAASRTSELLVAPRGPYDANLVEAARSKLRDRQAKADEAQVKFLAAAEAALKSAKAEA